jgi:hypothetical protein
MDDVSVSPIGPRSSPPLSITTRPAPRRKRTRSSFHHDDSTPSDGPLFSSDPPDPSLDNYFQPQRKRQYRGTWWGEDTQDSQQTENSQRGKSGFARNLDSGVWMGSDNTEDSIGSDDTVPDHLPHQARVTAVSFSNMLPPEPENIKKARDVIQRCLELGADDDDPHVDFA